MASQAPNMLPLLYNGLEPLNRNSHGTYKVRRLNGLDRVATTHAIPVTVDEFAMAQRHYPIVFSAGDAPVPSSTCVLYAPSSRVQITVPLKSSAATSPRLPK